MMYYAMANMNHNNRPGTCGCMHPRSNHTSIRGGCMLPECQCTEFHGPTDITLRVASRSWPLVYLEYGKVKHILHSGVSTDSSTPALCGAYPFRYCWRGSGSPQENQRVHQLPACRKCLNALETWLKNWKSSTTRKD